ncbi:MAG: ABC transporter permease [Spirochaetes bacterium]|nr:ABC transporter permease [Spirochaetota bacterium]
MIEGILVEGLIYSIMVLGVFITFRILDFPDLTVDGSFPLGAVIGAQVIISGMPVSLGLLAAFTGGGIAGGITAVIHNKLKVPNLLAGILTMTMLYSVNIRILGNRANVPLLHNKTVITGIHSISEGLMKTEYATLIFFIIFVYIIKKLLDLFFHTDLGLTLGAMGNNEQMIISQGVNPEILKIIGLALSNGLVALSGALAAQYLGFADVSMGIGIIVSGLASVMIGEFIFKSNKIAVLTLSAVIGSIIFKGIMYFARIYGYAVRMTPNDLKLITGLMIIVLLILSKTKIFKRKKGLE